MKLCLKCNQTFSSIKSSCPLCRFEPTMVDGFESHAPEFAYNGGGFKSEYFAELSKLEASNFWFRARNELILWALRTYHPVAKSFLEVGCGTGFVLSGISKNGPHMTLRGSEIFVDGLSYAAQRVPAANFMQMDARRIPFLDEFDVIGAFDVLEHIEEDEAVLAQMYKALKPGGVLLLTVPQHRWLWSATDDYACHVRRYTAEELKHKISENQFVVERSTSFVSLLLPAMLLSRKNNSGENADHDVTAEFKLPGFFNECLYWAMRIEKRLIKWGVNFPVGGSRLVIARKEL